MNKKLPKKRQLAMVIDLNKCIGCQTCTIACKTMWTNRNGREYMYWNNVETYPGKGYPKNWSNMGGGFDANSNLKDGELPNMKNDYGIPWEYNYDQLQKAEEFKPSVKPTWGPNWDEDEGGKDFPNENYLFYIPRICNHCSNPSCSTACPQNAIFKRDQDGIVLVDLDLCNGCRQCISACPYKKIYFNPKISKSEKCNFCFPLIEQGLPPACAQQCSGRTRFVGFLDDKEGQVSQLVNKYKVALPLRSDFGVEPNVYYIPPAFAPPKLDVDGRIIDQSERISLDELESLFGQGIYDTINLLRQERQKKSKGGKSELMDMLISFKHEDMFRLDSKYYEEISIAKSETSQVQLDTRYAKGKFTDVPKSNSNAQ